MVIQNLAAFFLQAASGDWVALAGILTVITGISTIVGTLIARIVVKPMIDAAVEKVMHSMVSRELFDAYMTADKAEHGEMKGQLARIFNRIDHTNGP